MFARDELSGAGVACIRRGVILKVEERKVSVIYTGVNSVAKLSYKLKGSARLLRFQFGRTFFLFNKICFFFFFLLRSYLKVGII